MKKMAVLCTLVASLSTSQADVTNLLGYVVKEKGAHYRKLEKVQSTTNAVGQTHVITNSYFELATGMHRSQNGQLVAASPSIQVLPLLGAVAQNTRHQVSFASLVGALTGTVHMQTPDGKQLVSSPLCISYYDTVSQQSVTIADLKPLISGVLFPPDRLVYANCFTDFKADIEYKNRLSGLEQNLVFQEQPPAPSTFGLSNATTMIELWTEFFDPPTPTKRSIEKDGRTDDVIVDFGEMKIVRGKSFMAHDNTKSVVVSKQWTTINGRDFLIEQIPYAAIKPFLDTLPVHPQAGLLNTDTVRHVASTERVVPKSPMAAMSLLGDSVEVATVPRGNEGFVLDYEMVGMSSDVTFKGDSTYYVSDAAYLWGTNILEGGAVIKFNPDSYSQIVVLDDLKCQTSPYRPAFFTSRNDNSVGEIIPGSTGNPSTNYYYPGLGFANFDHVVINLDYCRFRYSGSPLEFDNWPTINRVRHCQFLNCTRAVGIVGLWDIYFQNVLLDHVQTAFEGSGMIQADHVTIDSSEFISNTDDMTLIFKNSLLVSVTNSGTVNINVTNDNFVWLTNDPGVFQTVGAGTHYLATNSPYRDIGTNDISAQLLSELAGKTTYPPTVLTNAITSNTTLGINVERDTNTLDLGYHYDALDYAMNTTVTNATLTLTNGVGVAVFGTNSLALQSDSTLVSVGTPTTLNHLVRYQCVQEQAVFWEGTNVSTIKAIVATNEVPPSLQFRFTELVMPSLENDWSWLCLGTNTSPANVECRNSLIWNGKLQLDQTFDRACSYTFDNVLLHRLKGSFNSLSGATTDYALHLGNDLFYGGAWQLYNDSGSTNWSIHNNAFDGVTLDSDAATPNSHNGYINTSVLSGSSGSDVSLNSFVYAQGALGFFYHGQSDFADAGNVTADLVGLYHFTTTADQAKETNSVVDIGFHYVAVDGGGNAVDTESDGLADYFEDTNGNGAADGGESDWQN